MAHKHNRRRIRPRSRSNKPPHDFDPFATSDFSTCPSECSSSSLSRSPSTLPPSLLSSNGIAARHWHNRYHAWQNKDIAQRREAAKIEAEKIKIFGGEPGESDDTGLCYKMMEVFEGMEWIESDTV